MLCLCDYILNILYSILELQTKLSEHPKVKVWEKPTSVFSTITPIPTTATIDYITMAWSSFASSRFRQQQQDHPWDPGPLFICNLIRFFSKPVLIKTIGDSAYSGDSVYPHKRNYEWRNKIQLISGASVQGESGLLNVNNTRSNFIVHIERYIS